MGGDAHSDSAKPAPSRQARGKDLLQGMEKCEGRHHAICLSRERKGKIVDKIDDLGTRVPLKLTSNPEAISPAPWSQCARPRLGHKFELLGVDESDTADGE